MFNVVYPPQMDCKLDLASSHSEDFSLNKGVNSVFLGSGCFQTLGLCQTSCTREFYILYTCFLHVL